MKDEMNVASKLVIENGLKLSEQGVMAIVMLVQKILVDLAQDRESKTIEELLEDYSFIVNEGELFVLNPVSFSVDYCEDEEDDCECGDDCECSCHDDEETKEESAQKKIPFEHMN